MAKVGCFLDLNPIALVIVLNFMPTNCFRGLSVGKEGLGSMLRLAPTAPTEEEFFDEIGHHCRSWRADIEAKRMGKNVE